jgi:hypothetical protein
MSVRHRRKIQVLWFVDALLLASCVVFWPKSLGIDLYIHDVYIVPAWGHLLLIPWLLLTLPLAAATLWVLSIPARN